MVKRRSFTLSFKLRVLRYTQDSSISTAAKHYKVSRRCIQKWRLQLEQIQEAKNVTSRRRCQSPSPAKNTKFRDLEFELAIWLNNARVLNQVVDGLAIKKKAIEISRRLVEIRFLA